MAVKENLLALCRAARGRDAHAIDALADLLTEAGDADLTATAIRCLLRMGEPDGHCLDVFLVNNAAHVRVRNLIFTLARELDVEPGQLTVDDLTAQTAADLLQLRNFGPTSLREVQDILTRHGLSLRQG